MMALDDSLITGVSCMDYGDDPEFNRQHNLAGFLIESRDRGASWTNVTPVDNQLFTGRFSAPLFVACGQGNQDCNGMVYVMFAAGFDGAAYWCANDAYYLARVLERNVRDATMYEWYAGPGPLWATDPAEASPVFEFENMLGENSVSYDASVGRYIMANYGFVDSAGRPRPWHQAPIPSVHRTQLLLLEAPEPWGPWRWMYRDDDWQHGSYTPNLAQGFNPNPTRAQGMGGGGSWELVMLSSCIGPDKGCRYTLNYQTIHLELNRTRVRES
eukprot:TRINITY_DN22452_c0_g1_i3.p1 TRINITY_DN22452_c0_g1~~TRINITY_DN22452_c0_g1_i3.p1  ORF type:complete len:271 (-),score=30.78 TRINITY_DN22452_c0_g1_i3:220-1032(-)